MLEALAWAMHRWLAIWDEGAGFGAVREAWLARAGPLGERLVVNAGARTIAGAYRGLDADGALLLRDDAGCERRVTYGDVSLGAISAEPATARPRRRRLMVDAARPGSGEKRDELVMVALGGLGEIGMNVYLYGFGPQDRRQWLMVDLGITFPSELEPGVDVVLPDLRFIAEERGSLVGIVLTHAHEDHIGAVVDLWPQLGAPVYATPFTAGMLGSKLAENGGRTKVPVQTCRSAGAFRPGRSTSSS